MVGGEQRHRHVVEQVLVAARGAHQVAVEHVALHRVGDDARQHAGIDAALLEIVLRAFAHRGQSLLVVVGPGQHDDGREVGDRAQRAQRLAARWRRAARGRAAPGRIRPSAAARRLRAAVCTQSQLTSLRPASLRCRSTTRASAGLSSTNNNRMLFIISTSLVLIGALNSCYGMETSGAAVPAIRHSCHIGVRWQFLRSGDDFAGASDVASHIGRAGLRLNPAGDEFARRSQRFGGFHPDSAANGRFHSATESYDESGGNTSIRTQRPKPATRSPVRIAPGAVAAVHAGRRDRARQCGRAAVAARHRCRSRGAATRGILSRSATHARRLPRAFMPATCRRCVAPTAAISSRACRRSPLAPGAARHAAAEHRGSVGVRAGARRPPTRNSNR